MNNDVKLNQYGTNVKIKAHVLDDSKMREIGFTDYRKGYWYYSRMLDSEGNISFNITIKKDNEEDLRIDILDEDYLQSYDYQCLLEQNPDFAFGLMIRELVESQMDYLQKHGVLSGHVKHEYI